MILFRYKKIIIKNMDKNKKTISMPVTVIKSVAKTITLQFSKDKLEKLCNALGLYQENFLKSLDHSEKDHKAGRVYEVKNLMDLKNG